MKSLFVEIYSKTRPKRGFVSHSVDEMKERLSSVLEEVYTDSICKSLQQQQEDPNKFPNIVIFLDENNKLSTIDEYIKKE